MATIFDQTNRVAAAQILQERTLGALREEMGVSWATMGRMLGTTPVHARRWGEGSIAWVQAATSKRIVAFIQAHAEATQWLTDNNYTWRDVVPTRSAAHQLGISYRIFDARLVARRIAPIDFGPLLGLWVSRVEMDQCRW